MLDTTAASSRHPLTRLSGLAIAGLLIALPACSSQAPCPQTPVPPQPGPEPSGQTSDNTAPKPPQPQPTNNGGSDIDSIYRAAIADAAIVEQSEVAPLTALTADEVEVVTWTAYPDSFKPGQSATLSWGETWVTVAGELQNRCRSFAPDKVAERVQQLLGLRPDSRPRHAVTIRVKREAVFRPCPDPDTTSKQCSLDFPKDVTEAHKAWFGGHAQTSYRGKDGFPWTRLGYTYDWGSDNEVGLSEYVIRKGTTVQVLSNQPSAEYCAKPSS